jgi:ribosomal protein L37AE/L43A
MSKEKKKFLTDRCPFCKGVVEVRPRGSLWLMSCERCQVSAAANGQLKVLENWLEFRTGMEKLNNKKL